MPMETLVIFRLNFSDILLKFDEKQVESSSILNFFSHKEVSEDFWSETKI